MLLLFNPSLFSFPCFDFRYLLSLSSPTGPHKNIKETTILASEADRELSRIMMKEWASFVKTGKPTSISSSGVDWKPFSADQPSIRHYNLNNAGSAPTRLISRRQFRRCVFIEDIFGAIIAKTHADASKSASNSLGQSQIDFTYFLLNALPIVSTVLILIRQRI